MINPHNLIHHIVGHEVKKYGAACIVYHALNHVIGKWKIVAISAASCSSFDAESISVQNCGPSQVDPEREPASPTTTTTQAVSQHSTQPTQNVAVDISANSNETATQAAPMPTSGQHHQTDNATRNTSTDNPSAPQAATSAGSSSQGTRRVLCTDPPPPYPGPPLNSTFAPPNNTFSSPGNCFSPARSQTGDPVFLFPYGPANHSFMIPVLPGQLQYSDNYPNPGHVHRASQAQLPSVVSLAACYNVCISNYVTKMNSLSGSLSLSLSLSLFSVDSDCSFTATKYTGTCQGSTDCDTRTATGK